MMPIFAPILCLLYGPFGMIRMLWFSPKILEEPAVVIEKVLEYLSEYQFVNNDNEGTESRRADTMLSSRLQELERF